MAPTETNQWIVANKPTDFPKLSGDDATFKLVKNPLPSLNDGEVLVKVLYLSNDPAQRGWISKNQDPTRLYTAPVEEGSVMRSYAIAEVVESKAEALAKGAIVRTPTGWTEFAVVAAKDCQPCQPLGDLPLTHYLGAFGGTGLTAYYGIKDIGQATADDTVVVSGAAGATGSMVVQIAKKLIGCKKVIGIAGSDDKCKWVESLGADVCVNYKKPSFKEDLKKATDGLVDVFFDNVGGEILDLVINRMKQNGRIAACGAISDYNNGTPVGIKNWFDIITMRLQVKGFIVTDAVAAGKAPAMMGVLIGGFKEGKLKITEEAQTVVDTKFEDIPKTWIKLFEGSNQGKLITKLI